MPKKPTKKTVARKSAANKKVNPNYTGEYVTDVTIETIEGLRKGDIKPIEANAIAKQVSFTLQRAKIQLEIMKFTGSKDKKSAKELL